MPESTTLLPRTPEVVVVGAGAAGVAATRRLVGAGIETLLLEARDRVGGRAHSVGTPLGPAVDIGCEWLHAAERNPWVGIAQARGLTVDETFPGWGSRLSWQLDGSAQRAWLAAREAFDERCETAAKGPKDLAESELLEPGNPWNAHLGAVSTWANGTELERVSVKDHARYENGPLNFRILEGYGTLISTHAAGLPLVRNTVVEQIDHRGPLIRVGTNRGTVTARAVIVTISTNLLAREAIRFAPEIPDKRAAAAGLPLGVANKLFLAIDGPVEDLPQDRRLIGALGHVATGGYQLRPHGWPMIGAYFGGKLAAALEREGEAGFVQFAVDEISGLLGSGFRRRLRPVAYSSWVLDRFANGSYSCALPGHADDRFELMEPVDGRLFFAGEACSIEFFGTAHGALISAEAAADRIITARGGKRNRGRAVHVPS